MACTIKLVSGDTLPQLKMVVKNKNAFDENNAIVDVTGATPRLYFRARGSDAVLFSVVGSVLAGIELYNGTISYNAPYDVPGPGGRIAFAFAPGDLELDAGLYEAEVEITFSDGTIQTIYKPVQFTLRDDF